MTHVHDNWYSSGSIIVGNVLKIDLNRPKGREGEKEVFLVKVEQMHCGESPKRGSEVKKKEVKKKKRGRGEVMFRQCWQVKTYTRQFWGKCFKEQHDWT